MPNSVYKKVELVGCSPTSITDAIDNAIKAASETIDKLGWFEVQEIRGHVQDGGVSQYQVVIKAGFKIER